MTRLGRFLFGESRTRTVVVDRRRAGYDAAKTTDDNRKHWADADGLAAVSSLSPGVRKKLRDRSRLETLNNPWYSGMVRTLVTDTVGTGPRLQLTTDDDELNAAVELLWAQWAAAADWALNCRTVVGTRYVAGECFGVFRDSKRLARLGLPVSLDLRLYEPDQIAHPWNNWAANPRGDDGIECDEDGDVVAYKILRTHPGDGRALWGGQEADTVKADDVLHWFCPDRPGQLRGTIPAASTLPVFAQLRRFTSATLTAAEIAAMLAGVLESDFTPGVGGHGEIPVMKADHFDVVELVKGTLITAPSGTRAVQFKPEQPTTNYDMFLAAKLREAGRPLNVPYGKMAGDHSAYNYSSGRLDDAPYWHDRDVERGAFEAKFLNPFLYRWLDFARFAVPRLAAWEGDHWWQLRHCWQYDARPTSDPVKDATADELNLTNGTDTLDAIAARDGTTAEELVRKRKRVIALFEREGLTPPAWATGAAAPVRTADQPTEEAPANAA